MGEGGMAEVYLAHDDVLGRDVALKVLRRGPVDEQIVERFRREARNVASLSHPNVVAIHDWGETEDGFYYLVMEYVPGGTIKDLLDREGPLPAERAVDVAIQTARALEVAHGRGLVHRDIKPHNVLLDASGGVKVTDFGMARVATTPAMTEPGSIVGTVHYISPEQATGDRIGPASDLYSLGIVLYEMLTGEVPYDAEDPVAIIMKHIDGDPRPPKELNPNVPAELDDITTKLLAKKAEDRYSDASSLIQDLEKVRDQSLAPPTPERGKLCVSSAEPASGSPGHSAASAKRRRYRLPLVATSLGLLAIVAAGLGLWFFGNPSWTEQVSFFGFGPETAEVPDVAGERRGAAVEALRARGFEVAVQERQSPVEDAEMVIGQTPSGGELELGETVDIQVGLGPPPERDAELLREEVRDYYRAVDRGDWAYTYSHLDSQTRALFTEEEWARRNQFFTDNYPAELTSVRAAVDINPNEPAEVTVYRTFEGGAFNVRETLFLYEDDMWRHRLTDEELEPFRADLSYEEFVDYHLGE